MIYFVALLRGGGGFMMDAARLWNHIGKGREGTLSHVLVPMMGKFKGETGSRHQIQDVVNDTY